MDSGRDPAPPEAGRPEQDMAADRNTAGSVTDDKTGPRGGWLAAAILRLLLILLPASAAMAAPPAEHATIQGPFATVTEVTATCLKCHPGAGDDLLGGVHWLWQRQRAIDGSTETYSKLDGLTNFGIVARTNPGRCLGCHISISPSPAAIAAARPESIDCLVCHDTGGFYKRTAPPSPADLLQAARDAGRPGPANCRTCHSPSCGLGPGLQRTDFDADIHLSPAGAAMSCQDCHPSGGHHRMVRRLARGKGIRSATGCRACHSDSPHRQDRLNRHAELISCQACHIPEYGRSEPVIIGWNWLLAGKAAGRFVNRQGVRKRLLTGNGFLLGTSVEPVFRWDNGSDRIYRRGDRTTPGAAAVLQEPVPRRPDSRIRPFAVEYGTQPYDARYRYLVSPQLTPAGSANIFPDADWETIARTGMNSFRLPYSGRHDFTITFTYRRLNHGTAPADQALDCMACHGASSRMNWQGLGYEQDPWNDTPPGEPPAMTMEPPPGTELTPGKELPPVRETILPVEADR